MIIRLTAALALSALMAACAHAGPPAAPVAAVPPPVIKAERHPIAEAPLPDVGLLAELPANAPPGECYARVGVPGQSHAPPPQVAQATWVQTAGPPGSPGPIWCLVPVCAQCNAPPPPVEMRYGWIRVICEDDLTTDKVRHVQTKLHERGYYKGSVTGTYDETTASALGQFQQQAGIAHGGYLSVQTYEALDSSVVYGPPVTSTQVYATASASAGASSSAAAAVSPGFPPVQPYPLVQQPSGYGQQHAYGSQQSYGYGQQAYGAYPQAPAYPQPYPQVGYPQAAYPQAAYPQAAYPQPAYPPMAYPQPGYPQAAYPPQMGYPQAAYPPPAYPPMGYPQQPYGGAAAYAQAQAQVYGGGSGVVYGGGGLPEPAYRSRSGVQGGYLTWPGKTTYY